VHVQDDREPAPQRGLDGPVDRGSIGVAQTTGSRTKSKPASRTMSRSSSCTSPARLIPFTLEIMHVAARVNPVASEATSFVSGFRSFSLAHDQTAEGAARTSLMTPPQQPPRQKPRSATPAERSVEFAATQQRLKEEAAERRAKAATREETPRPRRRRGV